MSKSTSPVPTNASLKSVFAEAAEQGIISLATKDLMCVSLNAGILAGAQGLNIDEIAASEVTLVTFVIDDSSSICGYEDNVRKGQNVGLDALGKSKQKDSILIGQWAFNQDAPYHGYVNIDQAVRLDNQNYRAAGGTPLYDKWCEALMSNVAYAQQLRSSGTPVRSIAVVITDGEDYGSTKFKPADCRRIAKDLLASEQFILAFIGIGQDTKFRKVAADMGIPAGSVLVAENASDSEMRRVFNVLSQSVIRASQTQVTPSQAQNNFFTP